MSDGFAEFGTGGHVRPSTRGGAAGSGDSGGTGRWMEQADQLAAMGFDKQRALEILDIVNGNLETAMDMLSP
eukprot:CAMPEP_0180207836 /NCGR_PEP_ID=MMETSP0987-20121128/10392_1 /TAXON_ID=697907 /ORGANISM="non described non described, Strain CCMP2293" /LENGTH=71 /DNA_ID=CAMNT_0022163889 /DNA_START=30 /DNA_END=245 /DNA_ORIENTATION=+